MYYVYYMPRDTGLSRGHIKHISALIANNGNDLATEHASSHFCLKIGPMPPHWLRQGRGGGGGIFKKRWGIAKNSSNTFFAYKICLF